MNHKKTKELETFQLFMSSNLKTETEDIQKRLHEIKIPIITNDVEVAKFIAEYHLDNPENMINFFLDVSFAAVDNISSSVDDLKQIDLINSVSKIKSAENMYKLASDNPKEKKQYLWSAQNKLFDATEELKNKILLYIDKTREIDNYSKYKFKIYSMFLRTKIDTCNECAKFGLKALEQAIKIQILISKEIGVNISNSVINPFKSYIEDNLLKSDTCRLMHEYAKEKKDLFWLNVHEMPEQIFMIDKVIERYMEEVDFDNIIF